MDTANYTATSTHQRDGLTATAWLQAVADTALPDVVAAAAERLDIAPADMPAVRVRVQRSHGVGRGMATSRRTGGCIGQTLHPVCSGDGAVEVTLSPVLGGSATVNTTEVVQVLIHELVHAVLFMVSTSVPEYMGKQFGHGADFGAIANTVGCEGKPTHTVHGADLMAWTHSTIVPAFGLYPAPPIDMMPEIPGGTTNPGPATPDSPAGPSHGPDGRRKQGTRMIAVRCATDDCDAKGYTARTTRKWLDYGAPLCPCCSNPMSQD